MTRRDNVAQRSGSVAFAAFDAPLLLDRRGTVDRRAYTATGETPVPRFPRMTSAALLRYRPSPMPNTTAQIRDLLGKEADELLSYVAKGFPASALHLPGGDFIDRVVSLSDRTPSTLRNFNSILTHGRLAGTGHVSILPVDQGIEHSAGASFSANPLYFDPENIVKLAIEGGCNAVASTLGVLGAVSRKYAHKIPFIVKLNHNELLSYPNKYDQIPFGSVAQAFDMGAVAIGATIYFGSAESDRQIQEVSQMFAEAHEYGLVTILWCYLRNDGFKKGGTDYDLAADLTGQANHLGVTIQADIIKQKLPETNGGYTALKFGKTDQRVYDNLTPANNPIEMTRYQLANCYLGRSPLINSGGASGKNDFAEAARTAVINKRAGGMGLITGRKAFMRPMDEGIKLLNLVQDVYLDPTIAVA
jgi:class I fructose-bisphosphate aldolase